MSDKKAIGQIEFTDKTIPIFKIWTAENNEKRLNIFETEYGYFLKADLLDSNGTLIQEQTMLLSEESFKAYFVLMGTILLNEKDDTLGEIFNKFEVTSSEKEI